MNKKPTAEKTAETAGQAENPVAEKPEKNKPEVRVYCGPSVRAVARQFTVYCGELPEPLEAFIRDHPAAAGLLVPVESFAQTRRNLETPGTPEAILYNKVKSEL